VSPRGCAVSSASPRGSGLSRVRRPTRRRTGRARGAIRG